MSKGYFVTFEGGEGSGKTSLINRLFDYLKTKYDVIKTREPGSTELGDEIREIVLDKKDLQITALSELCLFLASRAQHIKEIIKPALNQEKIVLCDRFNDSSVVYQGYVRNLKMDRVQDLCLFISDNLTPNLTFYLDIDPEKSMERIKGNIDRIESEGIAFHKKIREGFSLLAKKDNKRIIVIDASLPRDKVFEIALTHLKKALSFYGFE